MAWQDDMTEILRVLINDMDSTSQKYTDANLERVLIASAYQVTKETTFNNNYTIDIGNGSISPDPTISSNKDESFVNLCCLKAACIIDRGAAISASSQAISIKDNKSSIDLRGTLEGKLALLKNGWCSVYEEARNEHKMNKSVVAGSAIMTPFRLYSRDIQNNIRERY